MNERRESPGEKQRFQQDRIHLESGAIVGQTSDAIQDQVDDLLADRVMTSCVVVGRILLARDELLRMEQRPVGSSTDFIWKIY
jgi:hypothetical protein